MAKIIWLGQAGLLFGFPECTVMIDPYLSDSVGKLNPKCTRRVPVKEDLFEIKPNVMVFTHNHIDHYDPETAHRFITSETTVTALSPFSVWENLRKRGGDNNYVCFNVGTSFTVNGIIFTAVKAEHSDPYAIGVIIDDGDKKYYVTGDTLYNENIFSQIPKDIYAVFLPVNGTGNNMNFSDADRFLSRINPKYAVPVHIGLLDGLTAEKLEYKNKIIPEIYKEIKL